MPRWDVAVVGAGLAGLNCARILRDQGLRVAIFDSDNAVGGRARTDRESGFCFDRGFQVLQTAYPEARSALDYSRLKLQAYEPGALIQTHRGRVKMVDPWRRPSALFGTLSNGIGTLLDRWKLARLRREAAAEWARITDSTDSTNDCSVAELLLSHYGFSQDFVDRFMRPWISGMFFDERLESSARFFKFVFHMLSVGDAAIPEDGIQAMAEQLSQHLDPAAVLLNRRVEQLKDGEVKLEGGEVHHAKHIVLAVPGHNVGQLDPQIADSLQLPEFSATECYYFSSSTPPPIGRFLLLNGNIDGHFQSGVISNVTVPSNVSSSYSPPGRSLICVNLRPSLVSQKSEPPDRQQSVDLSLAADNSPERHRLEDSSKESAIRDQLKDWFGASVEDWQFLRRYRILHAIPRWLPNHNPKFSKNHSDSIHHCGDYLESPSIHGALKSGRKVAESVLYYKN